MHRDPTETNYLFFFSLQVDLDGKSKWIPECDYYCDTKYLLPYSSFVKLPAGY